MPIKKSAWKDLRKNSKRRQRNIAVKSELKTLAKKLEKFLDAAKKPRLRIYTEYSVQNWTRQHPVKSYTRIPHQETRPAL